MAEVDSIHSLLLMVALGDQDNQASVLVDNMTHPLEEHKKCYSKNGIATPGLGELELRGMRIVEDSADARETHN